jgi:hypothetical protein
MRWSPPEQKAQPPSLGEGPLPVIQHDAHVAPLPRVVEHAVELVDGVRAERVAHLGTIEGHAHDAERDVAVVREVGEREPGDVLPLRGVEERGDQARHGRGFGS